MASVGNDDLDLVGLAVMVRVVTGTDCTGVLTADSVGVETGRGRKKVAFFVLWELLCFLLTTLLVLVGSSY